MGNPCIPWNKARLRRRCPQMVLAVLGSCLIFCTLRGALGTPLPLYASSAAASWLYAIALHG